MVSKLMDRGVHRCHIASSRLKTDEALSIADCYWLEESPLAEAAQKLEIRIRACLQALWIVNRVFPQPVRRASGPTYGRRKFLGALLHLDIQRLAQWREVVKSHGRMSALPKPAR